MRQFSLSSTEVAYHCSPSFQTAFVYQFVFTCFLTSAFISFLSCQVSSHNIHQWKIDHFLNVFRMLHLLLHNSIIVVFNV